MFIKNFNIPPKIRHPQNITLNGVLLVHTCTLRFPFLAHLSHQAHKVNLEYMHAVASVLCSPFANISSPSVLDQFKQNFMLSLHGKEERKFMHVTKMAAAPIHGKNSLKIFFSRTRRLMTLGLGM